MILNSLEKKGLISPPPFVVSNCQFLTIMGSHSYGVADTAVKSSMPDMDVYGFCIPPKEYIFPTQQIKGFGTQSPNFDQWSQAHILDDESHGGKGQEYDFTIFGIVRIFELCRQGNPNALDSIFTREECVLHCTAVGRMVRDNRKHFISKEVWPKMRGYAFSQMHKMTSKDFAGREILERILSFEEDHQIDRKTSIKDVEEEFYLRKREGSNSVLSKLSDNDLKIYYDMFQAGIEKSKRFEIHKFHQYDTKFAYHILRLLDQCQQLLETGEMDLQRAKEAMKSIRRGEWDIKQIVDWATAKEKELDIAFTNCSLPAKADESKLKTILIQCLEHHYGNLSAVFTQPEWAEHTLRSIDTLLQEVRSKLYN